MARAPDARAVSRAEGGRTECAFTGPYSAHKGKGAYRCAGCGAELFRSDDKFDSGTGWPSFWRAVASDRVRKVEIGRASCRERV